MPLFKSSPKSPQDLVRSLRESLQVLSSSDGSSRKSDKVMIGQHLPFSLSRFKVE